MWNTVHCAVRGKSHIKEDIPCQDKTYALESEEGYVIALADGAGSARLSQYGAEYVTKSVCESLMKDFDVYFSEEDGVAIKRKIIHDLRNGLEEVASEQVCQIKDLASTLLVAAVNKGRYILVHIGDGVIGFLRDDELKVATQPENGEYANTTVFVTSADVLHSMKILKGNLGTINGFVLMSDGTENSLYDKREKRLAPAVKKLMKLSQVMVKECLESELKDCFEEVVKEVTTDDCSIAMLVQEDSSFKGYNELTQDQKEKMLGFEAGELSKKKRKSYDAILNYLTTPNTLDKVSWQIFMLKKYANRYLEQLLEQNLIVKQDGLYRTAVILNKEK